MKTKKVVILGSSRGDGNTRQQVDALVALSDCDIIDLQEYRISYYDYENANHTDDFHGLMKDVLERYETLIFATPVYWYAMSGIMKVFFDRISDLLRIEKELGRQLSGKNMAVLSCSNGDNLAEDFWHPFMRTAEYLGMNYLGHQHTYLEEIDLKTLKEFSEVLDS